MLCITSTCATRYEARALHRNCIATPFLKPQAHSCTPSKGQTQNDCYCGGPRPFTCLSRSSCHENVEVGRSCLLPSVSKARWCDVESTSAWVQSPNDRRGQA